MPKRPVTPPSAIEEEYLAVVTPYPLNPNWEIERDRIEFARWIAYAMGPEEALNYFYAFYYKPRALGMVIIEISKSYSWLKQRLLGLHDWSSLLNNPTQEEKGRNSRVFFCLHKTGRTVQKDGWKRIAFESSWLMNWDQSKFRPEYPPTTWCLPPPEDQTNKKLCRPLPAQQFPPPAKPITPVVGSTGWNQKKDTAPQTQAQCGPSEPGRGRGAVASGTPKLSAPAAATIKSQGSSTPTVITLGSARGKAPSGSSKPTSISAPWAKQRSISTGAPSAAVSDWPAPAATAMKATASAGGPAWNKPLVESPAIKASLANSQSAWKKPLATPSAPPASAWGKPTPRPAANAASAWGSAAPTSTRSPPSAVSRAASTSARSTSGTSTPNTADPTSLARSLSSMEIEDAISHNIYDDFSGPIPPDPMEPYTALDEPPKKPVLLCKEHEIECSRAVCSVYAKQWKERERQERAREKKAEKRARGGWRGNGGARNGSAITSRASEDDGWATVPPTPGAASSAASDSAPTVQTQPPNWGDDDQDYETGQNEDPYGDEGDIWGSDDD